MRVALYARYSTTLQNERSVDDQFAVCEEKCAAEGWTIVYRYSDKAMSGSSMAQRIGVLEIMEAAKRGEFDLVVAESLDRISRDQEETAGVYKRLKFANITIRTLAEGPITELHVGFKGTMNALELQHIKARVRRGQLGSVEEGKLHGGKAYGYRTIRTTENPTGLREIVSHEAEIVRRIYTEYNSGISPVAIAKKLNAEGVPGPTGGTWRATTITGSRKRVNGILRNSLYVGKVLWGRNFNVRDPDTGMRLMKSNDPSQFVSGEISDELKSNLRIVDDETWSNAQKRLSERHFSGVADHGLSYNRRGGDIPAHVAPDVGSVACIFWRSGLRETRRKKSVVRPRGARCIRSRPRFQLDLRIWHVGITADRRPTPGLNICSNC